MKKNISKKIKFLFSSMLALIAASVCLTNSSFNKVLAGEEKVAVSREFTPQLPSIGASIVAQNEVQGAEDGSVVKLSNKEITTDVQQWRFAPLWWATTIEPGKVYTFESRVKFFVGEGEISRTISNLGEFGLQFYASNSRGQVDNNNCYSQIETTINNFQALNACIIDGSWNDALNGGWVTFSYQLTIPETFEFNSSTYITNTILILTRPEAAEGVDNTKTMYFDYVRLSTEKSYSISIKEEVKEQKFELIENFSNGTSIVSKENVYAASNENVLEISQKEITTDVHKWRFTPAYLLSNAIGGKTYDLNLRLKAKLGEEKTTTGNVNFDEIGFFIFPSNKEAFMNDVNCLGNQINGYANIKNELWNNGTVEAYFTGISGEWFDYDSTIVLPETYTYGQNEYKVDSLIVLIRPEAAAGPENTKTIYVDNLSIFGIQKSSADLYPVTKDLEPILTDASAMLPKSDVDGAETSSVLYISNKTITSEMQKWRFAPVYSTTQVEPENNYNLNIRFKIFNGEGTSHIKASSLSEYGLFIMPTSMETFSQNVNNVVEIPEFTNFNNPTQNFLVEGTYEDALQGKWVTISIPFVTPETFKVGDADIKVDSLAVLIRPEAADGQDNTKTIYVDYMQLTGFESKPHEDIPDGKVKVTRDFEPALTDACSVLSKNDVEGALSDEILKVTNKDITSATQQWRFAPVFFNTDIENGTSYTFSLRFKAFLGEGSNTLTFQNLGNIGFYLYFYNKEAFQLNGELAKTELLSPNLTNLVQFHTVEGSYQSALQGMWNTSEIKVNIPESYVVNNVTYVPNAMMALIRPEASDGVDNTVSVFIDHMKVIGYETEIIPSFNFAKTNLAWRKGVNTESFVFGDDGISVIDTASVEHSSGSMFFSKKLDSDYNMNIKLDGSLNTNWGNLYIILKDKGMPHMEGYSSSKEHSDNFVALQIGSDGAFIIECINGVEEKFPCDVVDANDIWYFYKQPTEISISAKDVEKGIKIDIDILGNKKNSISYYVENLDLQGPSWFGFDYHCEVRGTAEHCLKFTEIIINDQKTFKHDEKDLTNLKSLINSIPTLVTLDNLADSRELLDSINVEMLDMNIVEENQIDYAAVRKFYKAVMNLEKGKAIAEGLVIQIDELPDVVNSENYDEIVSKINEITSKYSQLSSSLKLEVTNYWKLSNVLIMVTDYEISYINELIKTVPEVITSREQLEIVYDLIETIKNLYNSLSAQQKALVTGYNSIFEVIKTAEENIDKAIEVENLFLALLEIITEDNADLVIEARKAYNELTDVQKGFVRNVELLNEVEETALFITAKVTAKNNILEWKNAHYEEYREAEKVLIDSAISTAYTAIDRAEDLSAIELTLSSFYETIETIKTDAELSLLEPAPTNKGCGGSIIAASALVTGLTIAVASLICFKKKED